MQSILQEALNIKESIIEYRRHIHADPQVGFETDDTISYVSEKLREMGVTPTPCGKAGITALIGGKKSGKVFLLRADMDALPIKEESGVDFAASNGKMHACGHDMHTAMLLGAAKILKSHEDELEGVVKLMFQSAEEIFEGANDMIESSILKNPDVDAALMLHVMAAMPFAPGTAIVSSPGISAPAADLFEIKVLGRGCHGSMPNSGIDPLSAAAHIVTSLHEISARELPMGEKAVLTIGTFSAGSAPNVIPDSATLSGSIRTFDEETRSFIKKRLEEISKGVAQSFRAESSVTYTSSCPTLKNDKDVSDEALKYASELLGEEYVFSTKALASMGGDGSKSAGSEDFAHVSQAVPSVMIALAAGRKEDGFEYPQHHPKVIFDESALPFGSALYAYIAMRYLEEN
jgi:hippurate hydrolase